MKSFGKFLTEAIKRISLEKFGEEIVKHFGKNILTRNEINQFAARMGVSRPDGWNENPVYKPGSKHARGYKFDVKEKDVDVSHKKDGKYSKYTIKIDPFKKI